MQQKIHHYDIVERFSKVGKEKGFIFVKEFALTNVIDELTDQRIDLVWTDNKGKVIYAFEFDTSKNSIKKSINKLKKVDWANTYAFFVKKDLCKNSLELTYLNDGDFQEFFKELKDFGVDVAFDPYNKQLIEGIKK